MRVSSTTTTTTSANTNFNLFCLNHIHSPQCKTISALRSVDLHRFWPTDNLHSFRRPPLESGTFHPFSPSALSAFSSTDIVVTTPDITETFRHPHQHTNLSYITMLPFKVKLTTIFTLFICIHTAFAFWRLPCPRQIGIARVDPLVAAGAISEHAHTIHGGNSKYPLSALSSIQDDHKFCVLRSLSRHPDFGVSATSDDLLASNCTSCAIDKDRSVYWTPLLYFQHSNGTFERVTQVGGMLA